MGSPVCKCGLDNLAEVAAGIQCRDVAQAFDEDRCQSGQFSKTPWLGAIFVLPALPEPGPSLELQKRDGNTTACRPCGCSVMDT